MFFFSDVDDANIETISRYDENAGDSNSLRRANYILSSLFMNDPDVMLISGDWNELSITKGYSTFRGKLQDMSSKFRSFETGSRRIAEPSASG